MRFSFFAFIVFSFALAVATGSAQSVSPQLQTDEQKILYTLGQVIGRDLETAALTEDELKSVVLGFTDSALKHPSQVKIEQYGPMLQAFMDAHVKAAATAELAKSEAFLEEQAKTEGAVRTPSGIVIKEIKAGAGATPSPEDTVRVHYQGTLRDGSVFDSSVERGEPATFPLNKVIPCWTEGVQRIHVGGKARLVCPPSLAYGADGRPGIPGNAALVFEVELIEIVAAK